MTFKEVLDQVITWLQQDQRISYRAVKRQFALEDDYLEDLKVELIEVKQVAVDQDGTMLVWRGETASPPASAPTGPPQQAPLAYTPPYLAEKILTSRSALEGERKQVTVRFCRKVRFLGQNPKIECREFNDLQTAKLSKKQLCDRTGFAPLAR